MISLALDKLETLITKVMTMTAKIEEKTELNALDVKYGFLQPTVIEEIEPSLDYGGKLSGFLGEKSGFFDIHLFNKASAITRNKYDGGTWNMLTLHGGGFVLCLEPGIEEFEVVHPHFGQTMTVSTVAMCLTANALLFNQMVWNAHEENDSGNSLAIFNNCALDAAYSHSNSAELIRFLD